MNPLWFANWRHVNAVFVLLCWTAVVVFALYLLAVADPSPSCTRHACAQVARGAR